MGRRDGITACAARSSTTRMQKDSPSEVEIAHVLFTDVVAYSRLPMEAQNRVFRRLQEALRATAEFKKAESRGELISLPTGDGLALVFLRDPLSPVKCALQLAELLKESPEIKLRMGIHSGPVLKVEDINANRNVTGGGINIAQRVMDCGDENHILLSNTVAEYLQQVGGWTDFLKDLGRFAVKHNLSIHLFNLCKDGFGNPSVPAKIRRSDPLLETSGGPDTDTVIRSLGPSVPGRAPEPGTPLIATKLRVAILYKRNAHPDEEILKLLETRLVEQGYGVFVDRHLTIGVEWAKEIEREVRTSDAVIALLSAASIQSEMLAYEIETAHDAAQQNQGKPRLLPVRLNFPGSLPESLARILEPLEYVLWESAEDNDFLVAELLRALASPPKAPAARPKLEPAGGAVPLKSQFYIVRSTDTEFREAILRQDSIVLVKGPRQIGKTSLLARGLQEARQAGAKVVLTDFQTLTHKHLQSVETFYLTIAEALARQLELPLAPAETWNHKTDPSIAFENFLRREILEKLKGPLAWGLDEVDRLFTCDFGSEVFGLIRSWHNARALDPFGPWERLTLAIAYATEAHLFITDVNQSPFNVGTRLVLEDFSLEQVAELNARHGSPLRNPAELARYFALVGGHPYLVRRGLNDLAAKHLALEAFAREAGRDEGAFGDHLRRILVLLAKEEHLSEVVRGLLRGRSAASLDDFYRLRSAGLVAGESPLDMRFRCALYATYLTRHLL